MILSRLLQRVNVRHCENSSPFLVDLLSCYSCHHLLRGHTQYNRHRLYCHKRPFSHRSQHNSSGGGHKTVKWVAAICEFEFSNWLRVTCHVVFSSVYTHIHNYSGTWAWRARRCRRQRPLAEQNETRKGGFWEGGGLGELLGGGGEWSGEERRRWWCWGGRGEEGERVRGKRV